MLLGDAPAAAVLPTRVRVTADTLPAGGQARSSQGCSPHSVREASDHRPGSGQAGPDSRADSRHSEAGHRQGELPPCPLGRPRPSPADQLTLTPAAVGAEPVAGVAAALIPARAVAANLLAARGVGTVVGV